MATAISHAPLHQVVKFDDYDRCGGRLPKYLVKLLPKFVVCQDKPFSSGSPTVKKLHWYRDGMSPRIEINLTENVTAVLDTDAREVCAVAPPC